MNSGGDVTLSVKALRFDWGQFVSDVSTDPIVVGCCLDQIYSTCHLVTSFVMR